MKIKLFVSLVVLFGLAGCASKQDIAKAEFESVLKDSGYFQCSYEDFKLQGGKYVKHIAHQALIFDKFNHELTVLSLSKPSPNGQVEESNITDSFVSGYSVRGDRNRGFDIKYYRNTANMHFDYIFRTNGKGESESCIFIDK
ncbi:hypothetical protein [Ferrimonas sp. SCSIO 43195]|uniref:hypothetical protein n=1 Tax=Ferrimonas sp. SCSIO 43195 TaxID=2822844 RepID=UPI002075E511|nr:hypothetical protein [Ferrimonas sp. SCSIO 43195]USD35835.1 hypothetical protein J8Z22_12350 [Ferrimonas sp. SCSIO 43195]